MNNFLISAIVPVYNVQEYLKECLDSIVSQTIGFENIQLILVDDGSSDNSLAICNAYCSRFPKNVEIITQPNSGVSSARNKGLEISKGKLITFLDGDDKWSVNSFELAYKAYCNNPSVPIFSCKMVFFDAESGNHQLNYKYKTDQIIDITETYNYPQLSSSSVFIRSDIIGDYRFLEDQRYSEDFRFINEILLDYPKMMFLKDPTYYYRRRKSNDSAIQRSIFDSNYYVPTCRNVYMYLFKKSNCKYGFVLKYLQFCVMYDLRWRLKIPLAETGMSLSEQQEYLVIIGELLKQIEDDIILDQRRIAVALQLYALEFKKGQSISGFVHVENSGKIFYDERELFNINRDPLVNIQSAIIKDEHLFVNGVINLPFEENRFRINYSFGGEKEILPMRKTDENQKTYFYGVLKSNYSFELALPILKQSDSKLMFYAVFDELELETIPKYKTGTSLDKNNGISRYGRLCLSHEASSLVVRPYSLLFALLRTIKVKMKKVLSL